MRPNEERQEKMAQVYGDFVVTIIRPFARIIGLLPTQTRMEKHNKPWEKNMHVESQKQTTKQQFDSFGKK